MKFTYKSIIYFIHMQTSRDSNIHKEIEFKAHKISLIFYLVCHAGIP